MTSISARERSLTIDPMSTAFGQRIERNIKERFFAGSRRRKTHGGQHDFFSSLHRRVPPFNDHWRKFESSVAIDDVCRRVPASARNLPYPVLDNVLRTGWFRVAFKPVHVAKMTGGINIDSVPAAVCVMMRVSAPTTLRSSGEGSIVCFTPSFCVGKKTLMPSAPAGDVATSLSVGITSDAAGALVPPGCTVTGNEGISNAPPV